MKKRKSLTIKESAKAIKVSPLAKLAMIRLNKKNKLSVDNKNNELLIILKMVEIVRKADKNGLGSKLNYYLKNGLYYDREV